MQTWWLGAAAQFLAAPGDVVVDLGAAHPSRAGAVELRCDLDAAGRITACAVGVGREHRGAEKLFEVRDLRAALSLADRHDWQAPAFGELSLALSVESALGILPPPRATWLRTLLAEHSRIHALLGQLSWLPGTDPQQAAAVAALRDELRAQQAAWSGNRLHPMVTRIGGVVVDVDAAWLRDETALVDRAAALVRAWEPLLDRVPAGLAALDAAAVDSWGLAGPFARAAGLDRDLRRRSPVLAWRELEVHPTAVEGGDARARLTVAKDDVVESARLINAIARRLEELHGPIDVRLPKIIRLPEGEFYTPLEAPWGEAGIRLVSRGEKTPWRVALRTASLANVQALEHLLVGATADDVEPILASVGYVIGDVDK